MAEENNADGGEGQLEISPTESRAREQGWVPKDDFNGDEHKWVEAGEFLRRGELFGKIESQNKELKSIRETLNQFKDHHAKVQETAYKKAVSDLKAKKKEALIEGDADLVIEVDEQLADVKAAQAQIQSQPRAQVEQEAHPIFVSWVNQNNWYAQSPQMRGWADGRGTELQGEGLSPNEVLRKLSEEVKEQFPTKFTNPNRARASGVESAPQRGSRSGAAYQPSEIEERMAKKFVSEGLFKSKQEYYAELAANNG